MALATNPLETFVWGAGGTRKTPEEIARDREIAAALLAQGVDTSPIGHWSQGAARVVNALGGVIKERRANKASETNAKESQSRIAALLGGLGGGSNPTSQFPPAPVSGQPAAAPMDYASSRVSQAFGDAPGGDIRTGIIATAQSLGIDPLDLATAISYETGGTFDPTKAGPTTQWGQHKGLIQFGEPQAQQYGVDWNNPIGSQLGPDGAVAKYLKDTGVQPGMGLLDIYSAINAGGVGRYDRSDANNGGAPGTVADKVNNQMAGHRQKAMALLGVQPGPQSGPPMPGAAPGGIPMPEMAGNAPQPVQVAQNGGLNPAIIEALSSPYASAQERSIAGILLEQEMQKNDPMRALEMEKTRLEMDALRNPKPQPLINAGDGRLYNPNTQQWITAPGSGTIDAPTVQSFYDEKGQEYKAQWNRQTGTWEPVGGSKMPSGMSLRTNPDGTIELVQGAGAGQKLTEGQGKDLGFYTRGIDADAQLADLDTQLTDFGQEAAGKLPLGIGNYFRNPEFRQAKQAADSFLTAILRKDTGAAITDNEFEIYGPMFLPVPGDDAKTIEQKRRARQVALLAIRSGLGTAEAIGEANRIALGLDNQTVPPAGKKKPVVIDGYTVEEVD